MAVLNPNYQAIEYASNTKLMELADELASTRKSSKRDKILDQAAKIRYFLKAVGYKTTYLTNLQVNNIYECLIEASEINDFPVVPTLPTVTVPSINIGPKGDQGDQGERGYDGGGTDFIQVLVGSDTVIDSFLYTDSVAARWDFVIYDGTNQRTGWIQASWDGSSISSTGELGADEIGDTSGVVMSVDLFSGSTRLVATVTSGTWTITGSRYFIPNNGNFSPVYNTLASGKVYVGNASNIATGVTISGDATVSSSGVLTLTPLNIVDGDVSGSAALTLSKLAPLTASRAVVSNGSGVLTTSSVTSTELGYLSGVTSNIQSQIDAVSVGSLTGAISTVLNTDLSPSRAVISNVSGKIAVSAVTSTELGYVSGVTSAIQTQLGTKVAKAGDTMSGVLSMGSNKITNLSNGTSSTDAVNKGQLDAAAYDPGTWTSMTLINSWTDDPAVGPCAYRKDSNGTVFLKGSCVNGGDVSTSCFVLPAGYRPSAQIYLWGNGVKNDTTSHARMTIAVTGQITLNSGQRMYLDNISFQTTV